MDLQEKHEKLLYPVVRVFGEKGAGSGTLIYCEPDPENVGDYLNFVLTNHHVVDDLIKIKEDWDSVLKKNRKKEFFTQAKVEVFEYIHQSTKDSSNRFDADIVAYSTSHDLALLKLSTPRKFQYVAPLLPEEKIKDLRLYMDICVSGCSMAHEPFSNFGQITYMNEIIENKRYFMYNAGSYFGNSGGALFLAETGELIGVPSRITAQQLGFGIDIVMFMGFGAYTARIYEFIRDQYMNFLVDPEKTWKDAKKDREKAFKKSLVEMQVEAEKELNE